MSNAHTRLIPLSAPVPPNLEQALGYSGEARYVAFYWEPCGDELMYDDGQFRADGTWQAYLAYLDHPAVAPFIFLPCWKCRGVGTTNQLENQPCDFCDGAGILPLNLGSSDEEATFWLILDRHDRKLYTAAARTARLFLREQWPPVHELTAEETQALFDAIKNAIDAFEASAVPIRRIDPEAFLKRLTQSINEMTTWLDQQLST